MTISNLRAWLYAALRASAIFALFAVLYGSTQGEFTPTGVDLAVAPYRHSIVDWEISHLPDKWLRRVGAAFNRGLSESQGELHLADDFFRLAAELRSVERKLRFPGADETSPGTADPQLMLALRQKREQIRGRQEALQGDVEEIVEAHVSRAVAGQGLGTAVGVLPPVDVVLTSSPHLLVVSPRDRIAREMEFLLEPGLGDADKESLEARIEEEEPEMAAYVANTGGVSLYPAVVADGYGLRNALEITAHEWLHAWLFPRPLGRNLWSSAEMGSLNETVATIAGKELGDLAYASLTGQPAAPRPAPTPQPGAASPGPPAFDFRAEMQETRRRVDELLAAGRVDHAESYMEERRQLLVSHGYLIRKLNQAYFAFHGTYATGPASVSPIGGQVRELRERSRSLEEFLRTVAGFGSYPDFVEYVDGLRQVDP